MLPLRQLAQASSSGHARVATRALSSHGGGVGGSGGMALGADMVFVIRHAERHDRVDKEWSKVARRPQDTPLSERGKKQVMIMIMLVKDHDTRATMSHWLVHSLCLQGGGAIPTPSVTPLPRV